jgi:hypothetical protein
MHEVRKQISFDTWNAAYTIVQVAMMNNRASYTKIFENTQREVHNTINQVSAQANEAIHSTN